MRKVTKFLAAPLLLALTMTTTTFANNPAPLPSLFETLDISIATLKATAHLANNIFFIDPDHHELTEDEKELAILINQYRESLNLKPLTVSKSLTKVARTHVNDSNFHHPENGTDARGIKGNLHSWSDKGPWKAVSYTSDHKYSHLMWSKPSELTPYRGNGFEISYRSGFPTPKSVLDGWRSSPGHNTVIIGEGPWSTLNTMGIGINGNYSHVWFGKENDPEGYYLVK